MCVVIRCRTLDSGCFSGKYSWKRFIQPRGCLISHFNDDVKLRGGRRTLTNSIVYIDEDSCWTDWTWNSVQGRINTSSSSSNSDRHGCVSDIRLRLIAWSHGSGKWNVNRARYSDWLPDGFNRAALANSSATERDCDVDEKCFVCKRLPGCCAARWYVPISSSVIFAPRYVRPW